MLAKTGRTISDLIILHLPLNVFIIELLNHISTFYDQPSQSCHLVVHVASRLSPRPSANASTALRFVNRKQTRHLHHEPIGTANRR